MLRLGLNKEEKDMLSSTIKELQELRAELSVFKDTLIGLKPEEHAVTEDEKAAAVEALSEEAGVLSEKASEKKAVEMSEETETEAVQVSEIVSLDAPAGETCGLAGNENSEAVENSREGDTARLAVEAGADEETEITAKEEGPAVSAEQMQTGTEAHDQEDANRQQNAPVSKDWAVVSFQGRSRPWWKFWEGKGKFLKKSV